MLLITKDKKYTNISFKPSDIYNIETIYLSGPPETGDVSERYHGIYFKFYKDKSKTYYNYIGGVAANIGDTLVISNRQFALNSMSKYDRVKYKTDVENFILLEQL